MKVNNLQHLNSVLEKIYIDEDIELDTQYFFQKNLLIPAFKHIAGRLVNQKKIFFKIKKNSNSYSHGKFIQEFQIKNLCRIYGKKYGSLSHERLEFISSNQVRPYRKVGIGIPFSGKASELSLLNTQIDNISNCNFDEIIILTSGKLSMLQSLKDSFKSPNRLKIYEFKSSNFDQGVNILSKPEISKKKNILFSKLNTDIKIIAHSRILFEKTIVKDLQDLFFEVAIPKISFINNSKEVPFLDIGFISSYSSYRPNVTYAAETIGDNHYKYFKMGEPYIDGGCNIFSETIDFEPYNEDYDWGESEDLEMCRKINARGFFVDRLNPIKAYTQNSKLKNSYKAKLFKFIFNLTN